MLKGLVKKFKSAVDDTEEIDEEFFAKVMKEIKDGYKEEGLEGKSIAMSGGDINKANSIYMQLRAEALQEKETLEYLKVLQKENAKKEMEDRKKRILEASEIEIFKLFKNEINNNGFKRHWYDTYNIYYKNNKKYRGNIDRDLKLKLFDEDGNIILELDVKQYLIDKFSYIDW